MRDRALHLAGQLLELGGRARLGDGLRLATETLQTGRAWGKLQAICEAQGGMRTLPSAEHLHPVVASFAGCVATMDNRRLAKVAKLAGAPKSPAAGIDLHVRLGDIVDAGQPLFTVHAQSRGELEYALHYVATQRMIIGIAEGS